MLLTPRSNQEATEEAVCQGQASAVYCHVLDDEYVGATPLVAPVNIGLGNVHALA